MPKQAKKAKEPVIEGIDGSRNDIRILISDRTTSEDAGLVEGVPLDAPDDSLGWVLVKLWIEHDTVQEKGEDKGAVVTKKTNPVFYQLWARPRSKTVVAKPKLAKPPSAPTPTPPAPGAPPEAKKGPGRPRKPPEPPPEPPPTDPESEEDSDAAE